MSANPDLFAKIRIAKGRRAPQPKAAAPACDVPGCHNPGTNRAPKGRDLEGQYFCFCLEHVREYNASYNYFTGMDNAAVAKYQKDASTGHRPTWSMGARKGDCAKPQDPNFSFDVWAKMGGAASQSPPRPHEVREPQTDTPTLKAYRTLGVEISASAETIRVRYKDMVKRLHPDANGGDRSSEERLREIIQAYKLLKARKKV